MTLSVKSPSDLSKVCFSLISALFCAVLAKISDPAFAGSARAIVGLSKPLLCLHSRVTGGFSS